MNHMKGIIKYISLVLIFLLTGISVFFASVSFSSYITQFEEQQQASVAVPAVSITNGTLKRTSNEGDVLEYDSNSYTENGTIDFYDIQPLDVIDFYFTVNNFNDDRVLNEVKLKVILDMKIYLRRLAVNEDGSTEISEYYIAGNEFLISDDGNDQTDMDGSNFSFLYSNDSINYFSVPLEVNDLDNDGSTDHIDSIADLSTVEEELNKLNRTFYDGKTLKYSGNIATGFNHYAGLIFEPGSYISSKFFQIKVKLPMQAAHNKEYVSGRLYIELKLHAEQML